MTLLISTTLYISTVSSSNYEVSVKWILRFYLVARSYHEVDTTTRCQVLTVDTCDRVSGYALQQVLVPSTVTHIGVIKLFAKDL